MSGVQSPLSRTGEVSSGGQLLRYRIWSTDKPAATIVLLHGIMSHSEWLENLAEPLARKGAVVLGADRRGSGLNAHLKEGVASAAMLVDDLERLIDREHGPGRPLFLLGWCWGAVLALGAMRSLGGRVDGLILAAPGLCPSERVKQAMDNQLKGLSGQPDDSPCLAVPIREEMFTEGPALQTHILRDELRWRHFTPRFHRVMKETGLCAAIELRRLTRPVLLILADKDLAVDNEQTLAAFAKVSAPITVRRIDCHHGIQFEAPGQLFEAASAWMDDQLTEKPGH